MPYAATQLLLGFSQVGVEVDCFVDLPADKVPTPLRDAPGLRFFGVAPSRWEWDRWYSRTPLAQLVSGQASRALVQRHLARLVVVQHALRPYDFLYRFSQIEMFGLRRHLSELPPVVVHPEVHAKGELRWHHRERALGKACEPLPWHLLVRAMLAARAWRQRQDIRLAALVVAPSHRFARHLEADYGVSRQRLRVAPNPVDLARFSPSGGASDDTKPITVLFVSRLSVRKGLELVVGLSHRLADLAGLVQILVVGDRSQWSDYRCLLTGANPETLTYAGSLSGDQIVALYSKASVLLVPSHYEPFGLTVAEALATGLSVLASEEVGAVEGLDATCCVTFADNDLAAIERAVRSLVAADAVSRGPSRQASRAAAERLFSPVRVAGLIAGHLAERQAAGQAATPGRI